MAKVSSKSLSLKAGEWVEVRSQEEILATLDERGCLQNVPFMPEMLRYCGQKFRVFKRADKTCDNIGVWSIRRMKDAVHLDGVRCAGAQHGDCQAGCLIFWKEAWLKRAESALISPQPSPATSSSLFTVEQLLASSQRLNADGETVYFCQATEVLRFTSYMPWWDPRQYIRDVRSGNLNSGLGAGSISERVMEFCLELLVVLRTVFISVFRDGRKLFYPAVEGSNDKTPLETLHLQPGELVEVRSREEIMATLDSQRRNRGLFFDGEMVRYCGSIYRVRGRVYRIVDEKTGRMLNMKYPCIILEGVACQADYHRLCPRNIYHYWRENWLKRVEGPVPAVEQMEETCAKY